MQRSSSLLILVALAAFSVVAGCQRAEPAKIRDLSVEELVALRKQKGDAVVLLDANGADFRKKNGILPGARLLSHYRTYDLASLPPDRDTPLVFYCSWWL